VNFNEELAGGRERVTTEEVYTSTARRLERDKVMQVRGLRGCENLVCNLLTD